jgi:O-antigen/teichoic acid export membrane protein
VLEYVRKVYYSPSMRSVSIDNFVSRPVKNFLFLTFGNGIRWVLSFFVTVYLARILGASGFGKLSFAFSLFAYAVLLSDLGLTILGTRQIAQRKDSPDEITSSILSLRFILAIIAFVILLLTSLFFPLEHETRILLSLYSFSIFFYALYLDWFFRGREKMANIAISSIITQVIYVVLVFTFIRQKQDLIRIPFLWFAGIGSGTAFLLIMFYLTNHRLKLRMNVSLLKLSVPLGIAAIMNQIYFHFDLITIGFIKGEIAVGFYNAGFKLITFLLSVDTAFAWVYFPLVSRYFSESEEKLRKLIFTGTKLIFLFVTPLALGGMMLAERLIVLIYGGDFSPASNALRILVWAIPLTSVQTIFAFGLIGCNREKRYSLGMIIGTVLNVVLNVLLIPRFGISGAAAATILSEIVMLAAMFLWFRDILFVPFLTFTFKPVAATALMMLFLLLLWKIPTIPLIAVGIAVYLFAIWLLKGITGEDLRFMRGGYESIHRDR